MVRFEQMLEGSRSLLRCGFDVVDLDGWEVDSEVRAFSSPQEGGQRDPRQTEHCKAWC
jgi:hypothetical protein